MEFGNASNAEYFQIRLQYTVDRWKDGYERLRSAEQCQWQVLWEDHRDRVDEYRRGCRNAHRQAMMDFVWLCERDKIDSGLAEAEEHARRLLYEVWLDHYQQLLPGERRLRDIRIAQQAQRLREEVAAANRTREAYEEMLVTTDEIDMCRREQTRGRQDIYQQWHDEVRVRIGRWHKRCVSKENLLDFQLLHRCQIEIEEEEVRQASLSWYASEWLKGCYLSEAFDRLQVQHEEAYEFKESIVSNGWDKLKYEIWWMTAKEVPRRWAGETV
jgi:hypothetical protein